MDAIPWSILQTGGLVAVVAVLWFGQRTTDRELIRVRDRMHELANRVQTLTGAVETLTRHVELLSSGG